MSGQMMLGYGLALLAFGMAAVCNVKYGVLQRRRRRKYAHFELEVDVIATGSKISDS